MFDKNRNFKNELLLLALLFFFNLALGQTTNSKLNFFEGTWEIDLNPDHDSDPYIKQFIIEIDSNSHFTGEFYESKILDGFLNTSWKNIHFAFATKDKNNSYYHSGYLDGDTIHGISYCPNREFAMPWKGTKLEVIAQPYIKNDSIFHALERQKSFNGIVLIGDSDSILFSKSYGFAQFNPNQNINLNTQFYIASLSKQFTATAILLLAQKNKLKLDQPVNVFIDNFPYTGVTIHHLLSQTSGIPGYIDFFDANWNKSKQANTDDVIEYLKAEQPPLSFIPGAQFEYSNTNYVILAKVIEIISKMSYPAYLEKYIFQPCNLTRTYASSKPYFNTFDANVAFGYVLDDTVPVEIEHCKIKYMDRVNYLSGIQGDGSVVTSINDLFLWHKMLNSNLLLSETSKALMFTPIKLNNQELSHYGYGWYTDGLICDHTGYWPGYQTRIIRNLKTGMIGITFKNVETNNWSWISDFDIHIR